jgi:RNA polymerase sigma-70 factor (ECF subfamily)
LTAVPSIPSHDDRTLLRAWGRERDETAFTLFVQRHLGMVQGAALRKTARPELAEEVAQAVFALAARRAATLAEHPCAGAWLHRTVVFESANAMRRERKHRKIAAAMLIHADTSPEPGLPDSVLPHLDGALNSLPEHDRRAVMLRFGEQLSYEQMAARLGKSADACQKQTSRALERLRGLLGKHAALSLTAMAAGLMNALSTPASAAGTAGKVSAAAIAAAPQISLTALIHHLIHTMSTGKQIAIAAGMVVLLTSVPLGLQLSEAGTLRGQIAAHPAVRRLPVAVNAIPGASGVSREIPGSRISAGVGKTEADRIVAMLRTLRGRMITSLQLVDIAQQLMELPPSHMEEALQALADFPGMMPAVPLRLVLFSRWAELDPEAAMAAGAAERNPLSEDLVKFALSTGWLERDAAGFAEWLSEHPRHAMTGTMASMLGEKITLLERDTAQQLRAVSPEGGYPGQLLMHWEIKAGDGDVRSLARELRANITENYQLEELLKDVAGFLSQDDPRAALDFLLSPPGLVGGAVNQTALATVMDKWAEKDLDAAATWAWEQKEANADGTTQVWKALSARSEEEILAFLAKAPDEAARVYTLQRTALESVSEPEKSLQLIAALPDEARRETMERYGQIRAGESLMKTSEWLLTVPDGPDKDAAIRGFAPVLVKSEAESAMIWAASITAEGQRSELLRTLGQEWYQKAPDAAQQWLEATDKVTDADRAAITAEPAGRAAGTPPAPRVIHNH